MTITISIAQDVLTSIASYLLLLSTIYFGVAFAILTTRPTASSLKSAEPQEETTPPEPATAPNTPEEPTEPAIASEVIEPLTIETPALLPPVAPIASEPSTTTEVVSPTTATKKPSKKTPRSQKKAIKRFPQVQPIAPSDSIPAPSASPAQKIPNNAELRRLCSECGITWKNFHGKNMHMKNHEMIPALQKLGKL